MIGAIQWVHTELTQRKQWYKLLINIMLLCASEMFSASSSIRNWLVAIKFLLMFERLLSGARALSPTYLNVSPTVLI